MESSTATNSSFNDFAVQAEMVAVEASIDVGNILWMFYNCLSLIFLSNFFLILDICNKNASII